MRPDQWKQIEAVYQGAQQRSPDERAAFLDQACADDDDLRCQVETLLKADEEAGSFLGTPALNLAAEMISKQPVTSLAGKSLGHYKIIEQIDAGGMGEVYRACDTRLGRTVALKLLPLHVNKDEERLRRFTREAKAASTLNHPNIATIYEIGEADGINFIAIEHVGRQEHSHYETWPALI